MKYKKSIISVLIMGCIAVVLVFCWQNQYNNLSKRIVPKQVDSVFIEAMPEMIEITDEAEINRVIGKLQLEKWTKKQTWDMAYAPNLFVGFREGEFIGLFGSGEKYAKIETADKSEYYIVPTEIYDDIYSIFNENKNENNIECKIFEPMKALDLPEAYSVETAKANGDIVNVHGDITNMERFNEFIENYQKKEPDLIRITGYTIEGDPIIQVIYYNGSEIEVYDDSTRDEYAGDYKGVNRFVGNKIIEELYENKFSEEEIVKYKRYMVSSEEKDMLLLMVRLKDVEE